MRAGRDGRGGRQPRPQGASRRAGGERPGVWGARAVAGQRLSARGLPPGSGRRVCFRAGSASATKGVRPRAPARCPGVVPALAPGGRGRRRTATARRPGALRYDGCPGRPAYGHRTTPRAARNGPRRYDSPRTVTAQRPAAPERTAAVRAVRRAAATRLETGRRGGGCPSGVQFGGGGDPRPGRIPRPGFSSGDTAAVVRCGGTAPDGRLCVRSTCRSGPRWYGARARRPAAARRARPGSVPTARNRPRPPEPLRFRGPRLRWRQGVRRRGGPRPRTRPRRRPPRPGPPWPPRPSASGRGRGSAARTPATSCPRPAAHR